MLIYILFSIKKSSFRRAEFILFDSKKILIVSIDMVNIHTLSENNHALLQAIFLKIIPSKKKIFSKLSSKSK